jgi:hypothetical protein
VDSGFLKRSCSHNKLVAVSEEIIVGVAISWIACNGKAPELLLQELGCRTTARSGAYTDHPLVGHGLPGGWYVMVADGCDHAIVSAPILSTISQGCSVMACSIEEHVMYSASSLWRDGSKQFEVTHQGDRDVTDLTVTGHPPETLAQIRADCTNKQAGEPIGQYRVDWFFEIPLLLAREAAGFMHDEVRPGIEPSSFEILERTGGGLLAPPPRPWWRFW